jgi:hypothetical protein
MRATLVAFVIICVTALLPGTAAAAQTDLIIHIQDESGFEPPAVLGPEPLANVPVKLFDTGGVLAALGTTDEDGTVRLAVAPGTYSLRYGGATTARHHMVVRHARPVTVPRGGAEITVQASLLCWHQHDIGWPMELDRMDMDPGAPGDQHVRSVEPGSTLTVEVAWWEKSTVNVPVWFVSLFGDWQPTTALAELAQGVASPSSNTLHEHSVTFEAPTTPGVYRVRLVDVLDYAWPPSFYTGGHFDPGMGRNMSVRLIGRDDYETLGEGTLIVPWPDTDDLRDAVTALGLRARQEKALLRYLDRADRELDRGDTGRAKKWLRAFILRVKIMKGRQIDNADAKALIELAKLVKEGIGQP